MLFETKTEKQLYLLTENRLSQDQNYKIINWDLIA